MPDVTITATLTEEEFNDLGLALDEYQDRVADFDEKPADTLARVDSLKAKFGLT